jgi:hypothetical protein
MAFAGEDSARIRALQISGDADADTYSLTKSIAERYAHTSSSAGTRSQPHTNSVQSLANCETRNEVSYG